MRKCPLRGESETAPRGGDRMAIMDQAPPPHPGNGSLCIRMGLAHSRHEATQKEYAGHRRLHPRGDSAQMLPDFMKQN